MKRICVFCGSSPGVSPIYSEEAERLGTLLARKGITLVYGGSRVGVMGSVANATIKAGGNVIGVIPKSLVDREIAHTNLTELIVVNSMHERKSTMEKLSDGFIALPGGPGTMEEFFEIFTWAQIGDHQKPIGLLNTNHYYDKLLEFFNHMMEEQFLRHEQFSMIIVEKQPEDLLTRFMNDVPAYIPKWISS